MTSVNLQQWIQHPETLNRDTLYELRNQLARYPYFQSLRLLYLKNLYILHDINFGAELRKAVLYIADRRKLFHCSALLCSAVSVACLFHPCQLLSTNFSRSLGKEKAQLHNRKAMVPT